MERDRKRSDDEVTRLILHNCEEMGVSPRAARQMVERCLLNRQVSASPGLPVDPKRRP